MHKRKVFKSFFVLVCLILFCGCVNNTPKDEIKSNTPNFDFLVRLSLDDVMQRIDKKENLFLYLGWTENSSECIKVQEKYLERFIEYYQWNGLISVVDLDVELPEALHDRELREQLTEMFGIRYAPAFVMIKFGKIESYIEWTPDTNDLDTGMDFELLDEWFRSVGLMS